MILITQLVTEGQKRAVIETFYGTFAASHDGADLGIRHVLDELQDEKVLSFRGQAPDEFEKRILLLGTDQVLLRVIALRRQHGHIVDGDFLPPAAVTMPVGNQVVRNAIQPGRKGNAAICIILNVIHRPLKDAGGEILRVVEVPRSVVNVVEDAVDVALVEQTKCIAVALGGTGQHIIFVEFDIRHD